MRSAVSSILSEMSDPSPPAYPDYAQISSDHRRLLVLVRSISPTILKPKTFGRIFEVLDRCQAKVSVNSADDLTRNIQVRFVRSYQPENNEWADFQLHRAVLGMVSVGAYKSQQEKAELARLHEALKAKYSKTLLCSRLIALHDEIHEEKPIDNGEVTIVKSNNTLTVEEENPIRHHRRSTTNSPHDKLDYNLYDFNEKDIENDTSVFLTTMFWLLEKTRVEKIALDTSGKLPPLLCAPFEKKDFIGLDLESRANKRRTSGRFKKHLGDLSLMCGLLKESYDYYEQAMDTLKSCNDWLWLANTLEGICAVGAIVHYPSIDRSNYLRRNSSLQTITNHLNISKLKDKRSIKLDEAFRSRVVTPGTMIDHLRDIVVHYSKYRHAGVMETEACIKAVQILIAQGKILIASEYLQNIVFINLQMSDEEKVQRFSALAKLYLRLGFRRKAAFFHRVAAMRCVAPQNPSTDWTSCYQLLLKTLPGYNINFQQHINPLPGGFGWPSLQIQIIQELVGTSKRKGDHIASVRHLAFIIQNLFSYLNPQEKKDISDQLTYLASRNPSGTPVAHSVEAGFLLPPVNIYTVPKVVGFKPISTDEHLIRPSQTSSGNLNSSNPSNGPFIFTPIQSDANKNKKINWVQGETASVEISVINPLPVELKITNMTLLHEGIDFEATPSSFVLQPLDPSLKSATINPTKLKLSGIPNSPGMLHILGYSCTVLGVKSNCRLKSLNLDYDEDRILIDVCPSIPRLEMSVANDGRILSSEETSNLEFEIYQGEDKTYGISLNNVSSLIVEKLNVSFKTTPSKYNKHICANNWDEVINPGEKANFLVNIEGPPTKCILEDSNQKPSENNNYNSTNPTLNNKIETFNANAVIKYTSNQTTSQGYWRQIILKHVITFKPSLVITWWDILPGESTNECYVVLDVKNLTDQETELRYSIEKKRIIIDAEGTCRIPIPVAKVQYNESDKLIEKQKFLASYLDEKVLLMWEFVNESRRGKISLADIKLNSNMISRLEHSSVAWTVNINQQRWIGMEFSFKCGEPIDVNIVLHNNYFTAIKSRFLCNCIYTANDSSNSQDGEISLNQMVPMSGSTSFITCEAGQDVSYHSKCIPCLPGKLCLTSSYEVFQENGEKIDNILIPNIFIMLS